MAGKADPLGKILMAAGVLSHRRLEEALELQRRQMPLASMCFALGFADEETLVRALAKQFGVPGIVLGNSCIDLSLLDVAPIELLLNQRLLPVFADEQRVYAACADPIAVEEISKQLQFMLGKPVIPHVTLDIVLLRVLRQVVDAHKGGARAWSGDAVSGELLPRLELLHIVTDFGAVPTGHLEERAVSLVTEDVTKEVSVEELEMIDEPGDTTGWGTETSVGGNSDFFAIGSEETRPPLTGVHLESESEEEIDLDGTNSDVGPMITRPVGGPPRVLIVDDDFATRKLLVKELAHESYDLQTAQNGGEAVHIIKTDPPDAVIIDVMLPHIDGFQVCRAIKRSAKYSHIPVILMSAVIDSGRVTDDVLGRYGADAYFEKPLHTTRLNQALRSLLAARERRDTAADDESFNRALRLYREGLVDEAMAELRMGLEIDPLSAKHHFVLANLLQKRALIYEAIDEYETTVDLMPDYFPALTRLAYLYYKKGFSAKAIDTWRRALPHCPDPALRENIEVFMRKLIADMQSGV